MKKEELDEMINKLETSNSPSDAYLAIYQYGGGPDESFAKANKEGLELFAAQLLKASRDLDNVISDKEKNVIPLSYNEEWIDGDILIQYIEPSNKKRELAKEELYNQTFLDRLVPFGCFAVILLLVISTVIGFISILRLMF